MIRSLFDKLQLAWYSVLYGSPAARAGLAVVIVVIVTAATFAITLNIAG